MATMSALAAVIIPTLFLARIAKPPDDYSGLALVEIVFGVYALWLFYWGGRRVVLHVDAIEVTWMLSSRRLSRAEILGYCVEKLKGRARGWGFYYVFLPVDTNKRELKLPPIWLPTSSFSRG
jgi:hypothetical protein